MGMNETPSGERVHIGFFGMRNAGKSSVVNAITGQNLAVVSDVKGTTTDPVKKAMELLPLGPVLIIDTPGMDDEGQLGQLRIKKAKQVLAEIDVAILVVDGEKGMQPEDRELEVLFQSRGIPYLIAYNKADLLGATLPERENAIFISAQTGQNIHALKERIGRLAQKETQKAIVSDLLDPGDLVLLVIPIDAAAPKGRLILPQQQTIRDVLDHHCMAICCQEGELKPTLASLAQPPKMVITDSQAFEKVAKETPKEILLTSFSILFARYKGDLETLVQGAAALSRLKDGDRVLISEGCTHHRQCGDIGTEKLPAWVRKYTNCQPEFSFSSGGEFPENLAAYNLIIHCGGCMLNAREMQSRIARAKKEKVPIVNYGVAIAQMHGILKRSLAPFPQMQKQLEER